jgi:hypothetical protein
MADDRQPESMRWAVHGRRTIYDNRWVKLDLVDVQPPGGVPRFEHHAVRLNRVAPSYRATVAFTSHYAPTAPY